MRKLKIEGVTYFIPTSWQEVSVDQFDKLQPLLNVTHEEQELKVKTLVKVVCSLVGIEQPVLLEAPKTLFNLILKDLNFLFNKHFKLLPSEDFVEIKGVKYYYPKTEQEISLGQYVDVDEILKGERMLAGMLAIILQPEGESYDSSTFQKQRNLMGSLPMSKVMPVTNFFLSSGIKYTILLKYFFQGKEAGLTHLSHLERLIKNGDGIVQLSNYQKAIYLKWIASLKSQLLKC